MATLTLVDVLGIQKYVFASNRLRYVVGGSRLVDLATRRDGWTAELAGAGAEVIMGGGGNAVLEFACREAAREFAGRISRRIIDEAPGLSVEVAHRDEAGRDFAAEMEELLGRMARAKNRRRVSLALGGLSVTKVCVETGGAAEERDLDGQPVTSGMAARRRRAEETRSTWDHLIDNWKENAGGLWNDRALHYPLDIDDLGRSWDERSLVGIVHVDGNSVGAKVGAWLTRQRGRPFSQVKEEYSQLSRELDDLAEGAFRAALERALSAIEGNESNGFKLRSAATEMEFDLRFRDKQLAVPIRPVLLGGDDLTFLCDGRLALDLAEAALSHFESASVKGIGPVRAAAGVAIMHSHAPFARGYAMAERLCSSAKRALHEEGRTEECGLDWHLGVAGAMGSLAELRRRLYRSPAGDLTCRPYRLGGRSEAGTWRWLSGEILGGQRGRGLRGEAWGERRSKVKALASLARRGPEAVGDSLAAWRVAAETRGVKLELPGDLDDRSGFLGELPRTPLVDAIELLDIHMPLGEA